MIEVFVGVIVDVSDVGDGGIESDKRVVQLGDGGNGTSDGDCDADIFWCVVRRLIS